MPYYAVARGHETGVYEDWQEASDQVHRFSGSRWKRFECAEDAEEYVEDNVAETPAYADGATPYNGTPRAGSGYGVYFPETSYHDESSHMGRLEGSLQTNNRASLRAIICAVENMRSPETRLVVHTDSQYCINVLDRWQYKWRKNGWMTSKGKDVANQDLIRLAERKMSSCKYRPFLRHIREHGSDDHYDEAENLARDGASMYNPDVDHHFTPSTSYDSDYSSDSD